MSDVARRTAQERWHMGIRQDASLRDHAVEQGAARDDHPQAGLPTLAEAEAAFRRETPAFQATRHLDDLRATDYERLDRTKHIYLDYTGGGLYADSQLRAHFDLLHTQVFGNPHSTNPTSSAMTHLIEQAR